jgi:beta-glucosidase
MMLLPGKARLTRRAGLAAVSAAVLVIAMMPATAAQASTDRGATSARTAAAARVNQTGSQRSAPSGSDASCPGASAAAAASAAVGAPSRVRAIGGDSSATVVWCPPVTGAGSVVSYTVTSSGGQTVTAKVPNDWAIGLAADGLTPGTSVSAGGVSFTWPDVPAAEPDNTTAEGQTIAISGSGASLSFLAAANNSAESGTGTIYYTDGSTQPFTLSVGNFWYPSGQDGNPVNVQVAGVDYANYPTGSSGHEVYVFEQSVPLEPGQTVEAVTLPSLGSVVGYNAALHVFAMAIG